MGERVSGRRGEEEEKRDETEEGERDRRKMKQRSIRHHHQLNLSPLSYLAGVRRGVVSARHGHDDWSHRGSGEGGRERGKGKKEGREGEVF